MIDFLMHLKINGTLNVYYRCKLWIKLNEKFKVCDLFSLSLPLLSTSQYPFFVGILIACVYVFYCGKVDFKKILKGNVFFKKQ